jgi:hypothetical protein
VGLYSKKAGTSLIYSQPTKTMKSSFETLQGIMILRDELDHEDLISASRKIKIARWM